MDRKERQVERYLRAAKHHRSPEEEKEIKRRSKERRSSQGRRKNERSVDWADKADDTFEREGMSGARDHHSGESPKLPVLEVDDSEPAAEQIGTVAGIAPGRVSVLVNGRREQAELRSELARTQQTSVAVGDRARLTQRPDGSWRVDAIEERSSFLSRPDPGLANRERVIAANVDRACVVVSVRQPDFRPRLIDRYLLALQRGGVTPCIVAAKCDLLATPHERAEVEAALEPYRELGYAAFCASTVTGEGMEEIRDELVSCTAVFVGQSGVGKSTLLNRLYPELALDTGRVRRGDGKGRHTTTSSTLYALDRGTFLIDTPGIRGFALWGFDQGELATSFPGFDAVGACRFSDCLHRHEPGCRIRAAVEDGTLPRERYQAYLRLLDST